MAYYGNILIIYDAGIQQLQEVEEVLTNNETNHEQMEFSLFVENTSLDNTTKVVKDLTALGVPFLFFPLVVGSVPFFKPIKDIKKILSCYA